MYIGIPNPNILVPLEKMTIQPAGKTAFQVLYNPESYRQSRAVQYAQAMGIGTNVPISQFSGGSLEILQFRLFFDSMSAGSEVGGTLLDKAAFTGNSLLPSMAKQIDVRTYTQKVYGLMEIVPAKHAPPLLTLKWSSLQFTGHLVSCQQTFVRFNERGMPLRAWLDCVFQEFIAPTRSICPGLWSLRTPQSTGPSTRGTPCGRCRPRSMDSRRSGVPSPMPTALPIPDCCAPVNGWCSRP